MINIDTYSVNSNLMNEVNSTFNFNSARGIKTSTSKENTPERKSEMNNFEFSTHYSSSNNWNWAIID